MSGVIEITTYTPDTLEITRVGEDMAIQIVNQSTSAVVEVVGVIAGPQGEDSVSDQEIEDMVLDVLEENDPFEGISDLATLYRVAKNGG